LAVIQLEDQTLEVLRVAGDPVQMLHEKALEPGSADLPRSAACPVSFKGLGAPIVVMALLFFGGYRTIARAALHQAKKIKIDPLIKPRFYGIIPA